MTGHAPMRKKPSPIVKASAPSAAITRANPRGDRDLYGQIVIFSRWRGKMQFLFWVQHKKKATAWRIRSIAKARQDHLSRPLHPPGVRAWQLAHCRNRH